jgi:hypothetical protein
MSVHPLHTGVPVPAQMGFARAARAATAATSFKSELAQASATTPAATAPAPVPSPTTTAVETPKLPEAPKRERSVPVPGHSYSDIVRGPRNGLYLNTSGNERHGEVFSLVKRDGKVFHVYGTGKDKLVVQLRYKNPPEDVAATAPAGGAASAPNLTAAAGSARSVTS